MKPILLLGGGKIGETIAVLLARTGDYAVTVADHSVDAVGRFSGQAHVATRIIDAANEDDVADVARGMFAVVNACPYHLTERIARAARTVGVHYLDLTEDIRSTNVVRRIADGASTAFVPQCGLAPGFISIVANHLANRFDDLDSVQMRVGALPKFPTNALKYNLTWSTEGLVNEYCQPGEAIVGGRRVETIPLEGLEEFSLDGVRYEAFNTSGGLGTLCDSYEGRVKAMDYKSVRYPGHCQIMKVLLRDLGLSARQDLLCQILESSVPATLQDVVLIFVNVKGRRRGRLLQESHVAKIYDRRLDDLHFGAIQITTASGVCAVLDLIAVGALPAAGLIRQEQIDFDAFMANRFGRNFRSEEPAAGPGTLGRAA